ncbi:MAG: DUF1549 domain-containing protein [Verrucomicrobiales bacterium]|nr:DUF1549 domain-containing protein [Verrucomicrobiales bacterium]
MTRFQFTSVSKSASQVSIRRLAMSLFCVWLGSFRLGAGSSPESSTAIHWSYAPMVPPTLPGVTHVSWPRGSIDRFVLAGLESRGLTPAAEADRSTLLRRLHFDLTGLPPTEEQLGAFADDRSPDSWERTVDRLLASPRFGEQWARHWMDVARYAESVTLRGFVFQEAWRYRDYLIDSFNRDIPFDRLILEQLAGDLLEAKGWQDAGRQMIATTFLALGNTNLEEQDKQQLEMDVVDEQLETIGKAFLGQTIACARCHDHKHDPIPTRDYYAMAGILKNVRSLKHANVSEWIERPLPLDPEVEASVLRQERELRDLKELIQCYRVALKGSPMNSNAPMAGEIQALETAYKRLEKEGPKRAMVMSVLEQAGAKDLAIHQRGSVHSLGQVVPRGFLRRISGPSVSAPGPHQSGRKELAAWIADPANPLTARVFVNRVWYWLMGEGLVRSVDNFGTTGDEPSHPALLDHLALQFIAEGWSVKRLVRSIVLSRVYQLAYRSATPGDIDNRYLSHAHRRRLRAEQMRDAMLWASGELCLDGGGRTFPRQLSADYGFVYQDTLRSVYAPVFRNALPEIFECFDFPPPMMVSGRRESSVVPSQALFLLNHSFVRDRAARTAERLLKEVPDDDATRLRRCYRLILGREPNESETRLMLGHARGPGSPESKWTEMVHALFASVDFRYLD